MRRRLPVALAGAALALLLIAAPTLACGGLIGPNGAVNLLRTTTFAGYHDGVEHYITVVRVRGRRWRVRLAHAAARRSRRASRRAATGPSSASSAKRTRSRGRSTCFGAGRLAGAAEVIMEVRIDALDITVLKGGAAEVGQWASENGFRLPPDAPEVLDFYAKRSPIFLAAVFDADAAQARGQEVGDGTPVHVTIPTTNPWVPIRILALGKTGQDQIDADVFLLTDQAPAFLPAPTGKNGMRLDHSADGDADASSTTSGPTRAWSWVPKIAAGSRRSPSTPARRSCPTTSRSTRAARASRRGSRQGSMPRRRSSSTAPPGLASSSRGMLAIGVLLLVLVLSRLDASPAHAAGLSRAMRTRAARLAIGAGLLGLVARRDRARRSRSRAAARRP